MNKILLIEDNLEVRENTEEILTLASYKVLTAPNGKLGVELAHFWFLVSSLRFEVFKNFSGSGYTAEGVNCML
jgi:hypothetical protein